MKLKKIGLILAAIGCVASSSFAAELIAYVKAEGTTRVTAYNSSNSSICSFSAMYDAVKVVGFTSTTFTFGTCSGDCTKESNWHYETRDNTCRLIEHWWER